MSATTVAWLVGCPSCMGGSEGDGPVNGTGVTPSDCMAIGVWSGDTFEPPESPSVLTEVPRTELSTAASSLAGRFWIW